MLKNKTPLKFSPSEKYLRMVNLGMDPSHANTLSWYLNSLNLTQN